MGKTPKRVLRKSKAPKRARNLAKNMAKGCVKSSHVSPKRKDIMSTNTAQLLFGRIGNE